MRIFGQWFDLIQHRWLSLFDSWVVSIAFLFICIVAMVIAARRISRGTDAKERKLAWHMFLASAVFYAAVFVPWFKQAGLHLNSWGALLFGSGIGILILLGLVVANYWCISILLAWPYKSKLRHRLHVWAAWLCTTGSFSWILFNAGELYDFITGGHFLWIPVLSAIGGVVIGEMGFCLIERRFRVGFAIFSTLVIVCVVGYKTINLAYTNATVQTDNLKTVIQTRNVAGCRDPANTRFWIDIVTGVTQRERSAAVTDFQARHLRECEFYTIDTRLIVEGPTQTFDGIDMRCIKHVFYTKTCNWIPAETVEIDEPKQR